jgi:hypothetical protein
MVKNLNERTNDRERPRAHVYRRGSQKADRKVRGGCHRRSWLSQGIAFQPGIGGNSSAIATALPLSRSIGRFPARFPGRQPNARAPPRFISAERWKKLPSQSAVPGAANTRQNPSFCWRSLRSSILRERPTPNIRSGVIVMCPTVPPSICWKESRTRSSVSLRAFAIWCLPAASCPLVSLRAATPISLAATSMVARRF